MGKTKDDILDEFCKKHCPNRDEREFFEKYGRKCPNCYPESYHYWLMQTVFDEYDELRKNMTEPQGKRPEITPMVEPDGRRRI